MTFTQDYDGYTPINSELDKVPQSQEAEQAILGALLYDNKIVYPEIRDIIQPKHFYNPIHVRIAEAIFKMSRRGQLADAIKLKNRFSQDETLVDIGGVEYLAILLENAPPLSTAPEYARLVVDMAGRREIIRLTTSFRNTAEDPDSELNAEEIIHSIRSELLALEGALPSDATFVTLRAASTEAVGSIGEERAMGLPIGLSELDEKLSGLGRGKLSVVAGRPSMGKTSLATNIARNIALSVSNREAGVAGKVGFFSQEMPATELGERAASSAVGSTFGIPYTKIAGHKVGSDQITRLKGALDKIPDTILIDETSGLTYSEIEKRARAMEKQLGGLDMIVVDYLQLMGSSDCEDPRNDVKYYAEICKNLKALAKRLDIHVQLLAQLSRQVENRDNKRPQISDLKGSSGIEDAADIVLLIYRKEKILLDAGEPQKGDAKQTYYDDLRDARDKMNVIIAKNKGGPLAEIQLRCQLKYDLITELFEEEGEINDEDPFA